MSRKPIENSFLEHDPSSDFGLGGGEQDFAVCTPDPELAPAKTQRNEKKVLILEDDRAQLMLLQQYLQTLGVTTLTADSIASARRCLRESKVDLALFDIQLPDGNGLELCSEVDEDPMLMGLPIIVLSSLGSGVDPSNVVRETRAAGGCYFISKPYDPNVLLTIIERALGEAL